MKIVVNDVSPPDAIRLRNARGSKLYVYRSEKGTLYILSKLGNGFRPNFYGEYHYGFINISSTNTKPSFCAKTLKDSIQRALNSGRIVMEFENLSEVIAWKTKRSEDFEL